MSIVIVKNKYQVVIPQRVREKLGITRGDILEAKAERGKITYTPKAVLDRDAVTGQRAGLLRALRAVQADARKKGLDKLTMRDIDAMIAEVRGGRKQKSITE
jgi:AbrB family looped-hinge helix DNA binding protein